MRRTILAGAAACVLAAAALIWYARRPPALQRAWSELDSRPIRARLHGFEYRPPARTSDASSVELRESAEKAAGDADPARKGVALLLAARPTEAVDAFTDCTTRAPRAAHCWSDRAAAEIEAAAARDEPWRLGLAFAAADRAVHLAPRSPEALFNRAIALEAMHLDAPARVAWKRYLAVDGTSEWAEEARTRLAALRRVTRRAAWDVAKKDLARASQQRDLATVRRIVGEYRQDARSWAELVFLADWADAEKRGDVKTASVHLDLARDVGNALADINGERLLADAVAVIDRSRGSTRATLADAHLAYREARAFFTKRSVIESIAPFETSRRLFHAAGSPMARVADYFRASCETDVGDAARSLESLASQIAGTPPAYRALRGQLFWQSGSASIRLGRAWDALRDYREALAIFETAREENNAIFMRVGVFTMSATLGRDGDAWRERMRAFPAISRAGQPRLLQTAIHATARDETTAQRWEVANAFYGLSLEPELEPPLPTLRVDASIWRALTAHRVGWSDVEQQELVRARRRLMEVKDPAMRGTSQVRLMVAEALAAGDRDPRKAIDLLSRAIDDAEHHDRFDLPEIHLERGRMWRRAGDAAKAIDDFEKALALSGARDPAAPDIEIRNSYFAVAEAAAEELIDLLDLENDRERVLLAADRNRATSFRTPVAPDTQTLRSGIPPGAVVLHFTALRDRLLVIAIEGGGKETEIHRVAIGRDDLKSRIARLTASITSADDATAKSLAKELSDVLLGSVKRAIANATLLVIVPDDVIAAVPFAALVREDGRYLIETTAIAYVPNAMFFARSASEPRAPRSSRVLTVGNPRFDTRLFPDLSTLSESETEAREVGKIYDERVELVGPDATRRRVIDGLQSCPIADFACHAIVDPRDPSRSLLLLTPEHGDAGMLYLRDVARLSLRMQTVVLAACRSSAPAERTPAAMRSFALAFLAAGARNAIGALWEVDDYPTRRLSTMFHRHLRSDVRPAESLRLAQITMLRSNDPELRAIRSWSGFQLFGAGD